MLLQGILFLSTPAFSQQPTEILRGQVTAAGKPLVGASVTVVGLKSGLERHTRTNDDGVYTVLFTDAEARYLVTIRAVGFIADSQHVTRSGPSTLLINNFHLQPIANALDPIETNAKTTRKRTYSGNNARSVGGHERDVREDTPFSLDPSDLTSFLMQTPGVVYLPGENGRPGRFSVLGASPTENNIVVDGSTFPGGLLPPGAVISSSLATTTFDPAQGQFSGGQLSITTLTGTNTRLTRFGVRLSGPSLSWNDPASSVPVADSRLLDGMLQGPLIRDKLFYFSAFQFNRTSTQQQSLINPHQSTIDQYGLIPDTLQLIDNTLDSLDIPRTSNGHANQRVTQSSSGFLKLSTIPTAVTSATVSFSVSDERYDGQSINATSYPASGANEHRFSSSMWASFSGYAKSVLNELRLSLFNQETRTSPYYIIPQGIVLVPSRLTDGRTGLVQLQFGGNANGRSKSSTQHFELSDELSWFSLDSRHRFKVTGLWQTDRTESNRSTGLGTFQYQTLNDLLAGTPTAYSRTSSSENRSVRFNKWATSVGDEWKPNDMWRFEYGLRLDGARPGTRPTYNPLVDSIFGQRTDRVPNAFGWSPRVGFSYGYGGTKLASGEVLPPGGRRFVVKEALIGAKSSIMINGGLGAFRNTPNPQSLVTLIDATGLPNATQQLTCVGAATPIPDWSSFMSDPTSVPTRCLDGTAPVEFSSNQPDVRMYDPSFQPPISWRASLNFSGIQALGWDAALFFDYSIGRNGASGIDLNLRRTPAFTLTNETDRPVYVSPMSIAPETGFPAPEASRIENRFGHVTTMLSDLSSRTSQIVVDIARNTPVFDRIFLSADYTFLRSRSEHRGLEASTAGDPFLKSLGYGDVPTHIIHVRASANVGWIRISTILALMSGTPFTPLVAGDVNGDGIAGNDRAFIFDPSKTSDAILAGQLSQLLENTTAATRKCLQRQLGKIAGLNSCRTGWHVQPIINIGIADPERGLSAWDRLRFSVVTVNVMSGVIRLLGLSNTSLGRAVNPPSVNPTLLYVDSFDPSTQQFRYRVNQQFGDRRTQHTAATRSPFQVFLKGQLTFGFPARNQLVKTLFSLQGDAPITQQSAHAQLRRLTANPLTAVLDLQDSLNLSSSQIANLKQQELYFQKQTDSIYAPLVKVLVDKQRKISDGDLMKQLGPIRFALEVLMKQMIQKKVAAVLDVSQQQLLPPDLKRYLPTPTKDQ